MKVLCRLIWMLVFSCVVSSLVGQVIVRCPNNNFKKRCVPTEESGLDQISITPCDCDDQRNTFVGRQLCYRQITLCTDSLIFPDPETNDKFDYPYFDIEPSSISNLFVQNGRTLLDYLDPLGEIDPFGPNPDAAILLEINETTKCATIDVWTPFGQNGGLKVFHEFDELTGIQSTVVNVPKSNDCSLLREKCYRFKSEDTPQSISSVGLPLNSSISTPLPGRISSISIVNIDITYDPINELRIRLVDGLNGDDIELFNLMCPGEADMSVGFSDSASDLVTCPPTNGQSYKPNEHLSKLYSTDLTDEFSEWILVISDDFQNGGTNGTLNSWEIEICVQEEACGPYLTNNTAMQIGPNAGTITTSTIEIAEVGKVTDLNISNLDVTYPWIEDLEIILTSPMGTIDTIFNKSCGDNDNIYIAFDDEADIDIITCPPIDSVFSINPFKPLSIFDGEDAQGTWTLTIVDNHDADQGTLNSWTLEVCTTCPEEYSVANNNEIKGTTRRRFSSIQSEHRYDTDGFIESKELIRSAGDVVVYNAKDSINFLKTFTVDTSGVLEVYLGGCN